MGNQAVIIEGIIKGCGNDKIWIIDEQQQELAVELRAQGNFLKKGFHEKKVRLTVEVLEDD